MWLIRQRKERIFTPLSFYPCLYPLRLTLGRCRHARADAARRCLENSHGRLPSLTLRAGLLRCASSHLRRLAPLGCHPSLASARLPLAAFGRGSLSPNRGPCGATLLEGRTSRLVVFDDLCAVACVRRATLKIGLGRFSSRYRLTPESTGLGVEQAVVSPAAISITAGRAGCSYRDRTDHTG